jgi:glycine/serine hydroxymethyltransferase
MAKARRRRKASGRRTGTKARRTAAGRKKFELSPVRRALDRKIKQLKQLEQTSNVREAIRRMKRCKAEVAAMCGTHMLIPV